jgi:inner membrane protein
MDNLTHSLTGALAAKMLEASFPAALEEPGEKRKMFWLLVASANIPDLDVVWGFWGDPLFSTSHHRGITHSLLFAPVFALLPALLFAKLGKLKNFKALWLYALIGILLHIFFDLITPFGTQILAPFSAGRYAWDWMFIIDPFFTGMLALTLLLAKIFKPRRRQFIFGGLIFTVLYLGVELLNHHLAYNRFAAVLRAQEITATKISAMPQPLNIFRWMGLAQTEHGVVQTFFSLFDRAERLTLTTYQHAENELVRKVLQTPETQWYLTFARHPWIRSEQKDGRHLVELRDLQFSIDQSLLRAFEVGERPLPFILRYSFSLNGEDTEIMFNGKSVQRKELNANSAKQKNQR